MEKGTKIGLIVGGILLSAGIGTAIYFATKKKVVVAGNTGNTGGGSGEPPKDNKAANILNGILNALSLIKTYTAESFPLKPGMKGNQVKVLQSALRTNFNELGVAKDGIFGIKTAKALKNAGYVDSLVNGVSLADFNNILEGIKK